MNLSVPLALCAPKPAKNETRPNTAATAAVTSATSVISRALASAGSTWLARYTANATATATGKLSRLSVSPKAMSEKLPPLVNNREMTAASVTRAAKAAAPRAAGSRSLLIASVMSTWLSVVIG